MPRFVILEHDHPELHWDLMLEDGGRLRTWRLAEAPEGGHAIAARAIPDHRLAYLDYEGPVSGGRGTVRRWESGTYHVKQEAETGMTLSLAGSRKTGMAELRRRDGKGWEFLWPGEASRPAG
jgi:hypothetical protein